MEPQVQQPQPPPRSRKKSRWLFVPLLLGLVIALANFAPYLPSAAVFSRNDHNPAQPSQEAPAQSGPAAVRGNIYDRNFNELALTYRTIAAYARPLEIEDPGATAVQLAKILGLDQEKLATDLKSERVVVWLGRELEKSKGEEIKALNLKGIYLVGEMKRFYPHRGRAAQVLGFANSEQGLDGLEFHYDPVLRGTIPIEALQALVTSNGAAPGRDALDLVLTLDLRLQGSLEQFLATLVKKSGAASATAALMLPASGAVLGLASLPAFDPNFFWESTEAERRNRFLAEAVVNGGLDGCLRQAAAFSELKRLATALARKPEKPKPGAVDLRPDRFKKKAYEQAALFSEEPLAGLLTRLDKLPGGGVDLPAAGPEAGQVASTPIQLLTAFSMVLNGGNPITPHLLAGVWDRSQHREWTAKFSEAPQAPDTPAGRQALMDILLHLGQKGPADSVLLETVLDRKGSPPLSQVLAGLPAGSAPDARVNYLLLAAAPQSEPVFALLVVLHQANFSQLVPAAGETLPRAAMNPQFVEPLINWCKAPRSTAGPAALGDAEQLFQKIQLAKRKEQVHNISLPAEEFKDLRMPEVVGKSLRHGLQALQQHNLRISIVGSGLIVAQHPRAGTSFKPGDACVLKLQTEQ